MILLLLQVKKVAYLSCDKLKKLKKYSHIFLMLRIWTKGSHLMVLPTVEMG